jgi:hypothetical protein
MEASVTKDAQSFREVFRNPRRDAGFTRTRTRCARPPAARQDDEALHVVAALDDLHAHPAPPLPPHPQPAMRCSRHRPGSVRASGTAGGSIEDRQGPVVVLDRRGMDDAPASAVARCQLARRFYGPLPACRRCNPPACHYGPFSADLTDWLSRTAADVLASCPIRSRNAICSSAQIDARCPVYPDGWEGRTELSGSIIRVGDGAHGRADPHGFRQKQGTEPPISSPFACSRHSLSMDGGAKYPAGNRSWKRPIVR